MTMRVLHVYRTYFPDTQGGLEEVIRQICIHTRPRGVESRILTLSPDPAPNVVYYPEAEVHRFKLTTEIASCSVSLSAVRGFVRLSNWADVIHYHFPWPFADILHLIGRPHKPAIVTYHSDIIRQRSLLVLYRPLLRYFLGGVDRIVATSPNYANSSKVLRGYREKLSIIPLGLSAASSFISPPRQSIERMRLRYGSDFFLFVGVLRYYKGIHILLEAVRDSCIPVLIAGDGPMRDTWEQQAAGLTNVHFLGRITDQEKAVLMRLCRAVVFPSHLRSEAFGVTLLEGAMHGKPLISTEIGTGTSFVNKHGETGFTVPGSDAQALLEAMSQLHNDPELAEGMGRAAKQRYQQLFTGEQMGRSYAELYSEFS